MDYVPWGEGPEAWLIDDFLPLGMGEAGDSPAVSVQVLLLSGLEEDLHGRVLVPGLSQCDS